MDNIGIKLKIFATSASLQTYTAQLKGENNRKTAIIFFDENAPELEDMLRKMFENPTIGYQLLSDCVILRGGEKLPSLADLTAAYPAEKVLVLGYAATDIGLKITPPQYQPFLFNEKTMLFADKLSKINTDLNLKKRLWTALQMMFV